MTWRNDDVTVHNAVAVDESFRTRMLSPGDTATVRFRTVGRVPYVCSIHPGMRGTVRVVAAGSPTSAPEVPNTGVADPAAGTTSSAAPGPLARRRCGRDRRRAPRPAEDAARRTVRPR